MAVDTNLDDLKKLELLCQEFYGGDSAQQTRAHGILLPFISDIANVSQLQSILANSVSLHALLFAASAINKLFTSNWSQISELQKSETRQFLLNYLYTRGPDMLFNAPVVLGHFIRLLCRIVKLSWLENVANQNIVEQVSQFLQASTSHWIVGLHIYTELAQDMQPQLGPSMHRQRRIASSFRDTALPEIFQVGIRTLQQFHGGSILVSDRIEEDKLLEQVLQLVLNCLSFDFTGTVPDESDEQNSVMIPHSWNTLKEENIPSLFFDIYKICWSFKIDLNNDPSNSISAQGNNNIGSNSFSLNISDVAKNIDNPKKSKKIDCAVISLSCLVQISALRRTFFSKEGELLKHLTHLMHGTSFIIKNSVGLHDDRCFHEFCRLLGRINTANQLSELCLSNQFDEWISNLYRFTISSLEDWKRLPNSKHYLLGVWAHMVNPLMYLKDKVQHNLETNIQQITIKYIECRFKIAESCSSRTNDDEDDFENPLYSDVLRNEQLDILALLGRCKYDETSQKIIEIYNKTKTEMQQNQISEKLFQEKIIWLVYMISALICGNSIEKLSSALRIHNANLDYSSSTPAHVINGELSSLVFQLMEETNKYDSVPELLELAYLYFLEKFKLIYVDEHGKYFMHSEYSERLSKVLGLKTGDSVLGLIIQKIGYNLQQRYSMKSVLEKTLKLFHELSAGINIVHCSDKSAHFIVSGRMMLKNSTIQYILNNPSDQPFKFLFISEYTKYRTSYYHTLARLLFMEIGDNKDSFDNFLTPLNHMFDTLFNQFSLIRRNDPLSISSDKIFGDIVTNNISNVDSDLEKRIYIMKNDFKLSITIICRDLRGICLACNSAQSYNMLFDWLINKSKKTGPSRISILTAAADIWSDDHNVMIPLLKFVSEFVYNKSKRITFDQSSANGILLFKEVSSIILTYGNRIIKRNDFIDIYREKYKGIAITLQMISNTLSGNYVNFGIFEVYSDNALVNSLKLALQMCIAIPNTDLQHYIKTLKTFYTFLDLAARHFVGQILELSSSLLCHLFGCIEDGLCSFERGVSMQCCSILDSLVSFFYSNREPRVGYPDSIAVNRFLQEEPDALKKILNLMLQLVITGENICTWNISRPLLGLILLHESEFMRIKQQFEDQQNTRERRVRLQSYFADLMQGVEMNLTSKNKDLFTRNLYRFSQNIRMCLI